MFVRDPNLWARDGEGPAFALTGDGGPDNAYAVNPAFGQFRSIMRAFGAVATPVVRWSPDGSKLLTNRMDERDVELLHLVESVPRAGRRPVTHAYRYPMPGEPGQPQEHLFIVDLEQRTVTPAERGPLHSPYLSPLSIGRAWWSHDGATTYHLDSGRDARKLRLLAVDPVDGRTHVMVEESGATRVEPTQMIGEPAMVHTLRSGEIVWYSQRDGWGHLYRYAASGELINQVTTGAWAVRAVVHIDEDRQVVYILAAGLAQADPYARQLCRVNLDGSEFARLTNDSGDHTVRMSPSGDYLVDTVSTLAQPPVTVVRDRFGRMVVELARADASALERAGWRAPERFTVKAADGITDIHGILWRPYGFKAGSSYPVIDHVYPGPQTHRAPAGFDNSWTGEPEAYAALGFAVVAIDGRGTPGRGKEFHDASYEHLDDAGGMADHVAALTELGRHHPWLDLDRVGVTGASGGGFAAVRAMLEYPEVFKVGVAASGCHDIRQYLSIWGEIYHGPWDPDRYAGVANSGLAANLRGRLLLIHGELDDNVSPYQTLSLVDALIAANKDFDLLLVPGAGHVIVHRAAYVQRRKWDFFVRHLLGAEPPAEYRLADIPPSFERGAQF
ncbi:S9 family peptidase [Nocardia arthritidis]|uniref:S9 family peptidase n=1 Tax=Nocardia arthritidis TaxID=228602 RepID=UPI0023B0ED98|nr:DPP IV N-terminal domain-containing protein [Nocardia arthritidis]